MPNPDTQLFHLINANFSNPVFDLLMPFVSLVGSNEGLALVALFLMMFLKKAKKVAGVVILAGLTLSYYSAGILKNVVGRPRPFEALAGVNQLIAQDGFSFPSGHSTYAFMAAFVLSAFFGRKYVFFSAASLVAFSRIYVGVHYPSDVISGAALGVALGYLLVRIVGSVKSGMDSVLSSHEK